MHLDGCKATPILQGTDINRTRNANLRQSAEYDIWVTAAAFQKLYRVVKENEKKK